MISRIFANPGRRFEMHLEAALPSGVQILSAEQTVADGEHVVDVRLGEAGVLLSQDDALVYLRCLAELMGCEVLNVS